MTVSNTTANAIASIQTMINDTEVGDALLTRAVTRKFDPVTLERFTHSLTGTDVPKVQDVLEFLDKEQLSLHTSMPEIQSRNPDQAKPSQTTSLSTNHQTKREVSRSCLMCQQNHPHYRCPKLTDAPEKDRKIVVEKAKLCTNCLSPGHTWKT
ncbi:unnamed protein product, partial [Allacma fusca]